jgi:CBS domain-containing protein
MAVDPNDKPGNKAMKARDIMTTGVVSVGPDATLNAIIRLMIDNHISGIPVVDADETVLGVVSEGDLVRRRETGTTKRYSWWLDLISDPTIRAQEYIKSHAVTARDLMTAPAITVGEAATVSEIADVLERNHIKRVPVVRGNKLVGIVSRANLIQLLAAAKRLEVPVGASDSTLRKRVQETLDKHPWSGASTTNVTVSNGAVELWGVVGSETERTASRVAVENTAGVKRVEDKRVVRPHAHLVGY